MNPPLRRRQHGFAALMILVSAIWSAALVGCSDQPGAAASASSTAVPETPTKPGDSPPADKAIAPADDVRTSFGDPTSDDLVVQKVSARRPTAKKFRGTRSISFNDITFEMEKDGTFLRSMLSEQIEALHGQSVRIRGFILPSFKQNGLTEFVLVRDNMECCFGPGAALYDCIMVRMQNGTSTRYSVRPVTVAGTFRIKEWKDFDGKVRAIYHLDSESVK